MAAELASQGWHLTEEGIASLGGSTAREAVSLALDTDFKVGMAQLVSHLVLFIIFSHYLWKLLGSKENCTVD